VILVDDGLATGATMVAAIYAARQGESARVVVAEPVAPLPAPARSSARSLTTSSASWRPSGWSPSAPVRGLRRHDRRRGPRAAGASAPSATDPTVAVAVAASADRRRVGLGSVDRRRHDGDRGGRGFYAEQNARVVVTAERSYRSMFRARIGEHSDW
jgi:hypothetical protein